MWCWNVAPISWQRKQSYYYLICNNSVGQKNNWNWELTVAPISVFLTIMIYFLWTEPISLPSSFFFPENISNFFLFLNTIFQVLCFCFHGSNINSCLGYSNSNMLPSVILIYFCAFEKMFQWLDLKTHAFIDKSFQRVLTSFIPSVCPYY